MPRELDFYREIMYQLNQIRYEWRMNPLLLGGSSGSAGGSSGAYGGVIGQLSQRHVSGDTDESFLVTSGSPASLLENLNNIRAWEKPSHGFWATPTTPETTILGISSGSWYHEDGKPPLVYTGGNTPALSAPSSGSRYDLLTINSSGVLAWSSTAEGNPPTYPTTFPSVISRQMPLWTILSRTSGSCIKYYDDGINHYIFRDERPFLGAPTYMPSSGSAYIDYQWYTSGSISATTDMQGVYYISDAFTLAGSYAYLKTTPSSGSTIIDIQYSTNNGTSWTSIYSGSKLIILSGDNYGSRVPDALILATGTIIRANIDSSGPNADTLSVNLFGTIRSASGGGTVTNVSALGSNGVTTSVSNPTTTPTITIGLGAITPTSVAASGTVTGSNLSGTNTGNQTITLTGDVTGSGTGTFAATLSNTGVVAGTYANTNLTVGADGRIYDATSGSGSPIDPSSPQDVAGAAFAGVSGFASAGDHVHRGVHSVSQQPAGSFAYGDVVLTSDATITITQTSGSFAFSATSGSGSLYPSNPADVAGAANPGVSALASRGDHVHRGVHEIVADSTTLYGDIELVAGTNMTISTSGSQVTLAASAGGSSFGVMGGRLSLVSNNPTADSAGSSTIYYTPYIANTVELWNGASWEYITFTQVSLSLTGIVSGDIYDVFGYLSGGNIVLELSAAWSTDHSRSSAIGYHSGDGRLAKSSDQTRRYLGTIRASAADTCIDNETQRFVWNYFNRLERLLRKFDDNDHTYASTWRNWNNAVTGVEFIRGYEEEVQFPLTLTANITIDSGNIAEVAVSASAGTDDNICHVFTRDTSSSLQTITEYYHTDTTVQNDPIGYYLYQIQEQTSGGGTGTFSYVTLSGLVKG